MDILDKFEKLKHDLGIDVANAYLLSIVYRLPPKIESFPALLMYIDEEFTYRKDLSEKILERAFYLSIDEIQLHNKIENYRLSIELFRSYIGELASAELRTQPLIYNSFGVYEYCVTLVTTNTGTYTITYVSLDEELIGEIIIDIFPLPLNIKL